MIVLLQQTVAPTPPDIQRYSVVTAGRALKTSLDIIFGAISDLFKFNDTDHHHFNDTTRRSVARACLSPDIFGFHTRVVSFSNYLRIKSTCSTSYLNGLNVHC